MTGNEITTAESESNNTVVALPPATDLRAKAALFNSMNNAESLNDHEGDLEIIGLTQRDGVQRNAVTGVVESCTDTTFFGADGKGYFTKSEGIARSARNLLSAFGMPGEWPDGKLTIRVVTVKLDGKRTLKNIEVVA